MIENMTCAYASLSVEELIDNVSCGMVQKECIVLCNKHVGNHLPIVRYPVTPNTYAY